MPIGGQNRITFRISLGVHLKQITIVKSNILFWNCYMKTRCAWAGNNPTMIDYHDTEWGVSLHDDQKLFEFLVLDAFQAGLSWEIVLEKRENFRIAFSRFNPVAISHYGTSEIEQLLQDPGIIRNRLKIAATIDNAKAFLDVKTKFGSFDHYIWQFVNHKTIRNSWQKLSDIPAKTVEAENMSKDLKKRGFRFVGPTICYAFMQASGMVNDHTIDCFRYAELG